MSPPVPAASSETGRVLSVRESLLAMAGLSFVTMMVAIDQTVVGTALPTVVAELNGFDLYAWVATAYLLTSVITIPIFGRLGDYYGRKPFVVVSVILFMLASVLCGGATSMGQLVLARGLQGIGGGMLLGTTFACVPDLFPDSHVRLRWQILLSSAFGIANAVGPTLGGFLTQYIGWRSVFFVNLPVGVISLFFLWRYLPRIRHIQSSDIRLDWQGAVLVALFLGSLQFFVEFLPKYGAGLPAVALGVLTGLMLTALLLWEQRCPHPLIPLGMFRNKSLSALFCLSLFVGFVLFVLLFYLPLMLQGGFDLTPRQVGLVITPLAVCITVGSITNARIIVRLSKPNYMLYVGFLLQAVAAIGMVMSDQHTSHWLLALYMTMAGTGLGFVMPNLTVFAQESAGRALLGIATALLQSVRMIGGMLGMAVVGILVTHEYAAGLQQLLPEETRQAWRVLLENPQVLVNSRVQGDFVNLVQQQGGNALELIALARVALVDAVHSGLITASLMAFIGMLWVYRLPIVRFTRTASGKTSGRQESSHE